MRKVRDLIAFLVVASFLIFLFQNDATPRNQRFSWKRVIVTVLLIVLAAEIGMDIYHRIHP